MAQFPIFNSFPTEIHALILEACPQNDAICLRLTCKYLYNLTSTKLSPYRNLDHLDIGNLCELKYPRCDDSNWERRNTHRQDCHQKSYEGLCMLNEANGVRTRGIGRCRTRNWADHCECFQKNKKLHYRLSGWMPKGLNYCGQCNLFTKRKKGANGRAGSCQHETKRRWRRGRNYRRTRRDNTWTYRSRRGGFGRRTWMRWFNNSAMDSYEAGLRNPRERKGTERYALRTLVAKDVDTRMSRDNILYRPEGLE